MNRTTLNKATSPDATPTPGYLFDEIAKVTHDPLGNQKLVEYLVKRLESPSPDVKAKVLNIIKHVCRKGDPSFRRSWQRESPAIKSHLQYHTVPDPLRGDEPSRRVRENAKEALEAVFDASKDERKADPALAGRIQGFGVSPAPPARNEAPSASSMSMPSMPHTSSYSGVSSQPRYSGGGSGSRYEGIGNPNFPDARNQPKGFLERMTEAVREKVEKQAENIPGVGGVKPAWMTQGGADLPSGYNYASNRGTGSYSSSMGSYDPGASQRTSTDQVWGTDPRSPRPAQSIQMGVPVPPPSQTNGGGSSRHRASEPSDGTYERALVEELCAPGGLRPVPPKDKLDAFCKACRTLDHNWIITLLDDKMGEDDWKIQHKALCVLEAVLQTPGLEAYADRLDQNPDNLEALYNSKNPSVRDRAQRVWKFLYEDSEVGAATQAQEASFISEYGNDDVSAALSKPTEINLLDFDAGGAMMGEMSASSGPNMFNNMTTSRSSPAKATPPSPQPVPGMFDSMSGSMGQLNSQKQSPSMPSMFENLSVKAASPAAKPNAGAKPAAGQSSFTFLATPSVAPTPSMQPMKSAQTANLFDMPLGLQPASGGSNDLFSIPMMASQPAGMQSSLMGQAAMKIAQPKAMTSNQPAPVQKKPDSFNFVQEALQNTRKT